MKTLTNLLTIISLTALFACNNPQTTTAPVPVKIQDNGVNIAYTDSGKGDTTLLFVHGWCINKSYWSNQVDFFRKKYRVVAIDLPGYGQSGKNRKEWNTIAFSKDIDSVIQQLHLKNVILIGHSMSGDIVLQSAIDNPGTVKGLVVVDIFKNVGKQQTPTEKEKKEYAVAMDSLKHHFKKLASEYVKQDLFYKTTTEMVRKRVLYDVAHADSAIAAASLEDSGFNELEKLRQVHKKLYLINSDVKLTDTTQLVANKIPFGLFYIHSTGHFPMVEKPAEFNALLAATIADIKKDSK